MAKIWLLFERGRKIYGGNDTAGQVLSDREVVEEYEAGKAYAFDDDRLGRASAEYHVNNGDATEIDQKEAQRILAEWKQRSAEEESGDDGAQIDSQGDDKGAVAAGRTVESGGRARGAGSRRGRNS